MTDPTKPLPEHFELCESCDGAEGYWAGDCNSEWYECSQCAGIGGWWVKDTVSAEAITRWNQAPRGKK